MFTKLSDKIINRFICKNVIDEEDREIYNYGLNRILTVIFNVFTTLVLGVVFGKIYQIIVFLIAFMMLRTYSGGYHANTPTKCYFLTAISITAVLSVMKFVVIDELVCLGLMILSALIIILLSPIGTENKPLDEIEKMIYRKKTIFIWMIEVCVMLVFIVLNITEVSISIILAQLLISIALLLGKKQNYQNVFKESILDEIN